MKINFPDNLITKLKSGDDSAFEEMVGLFSKPLGKVIDRIVSNDEDRKDVLQDTFLSARKGIKKFRRDAELSSWLYRIAFNTALMLLRKEKHNRASVKLDSLQPDQIEQLIDDASIGAPSVIDFMEAQELARCVRQAVAKLHPSSREAIILRYFRDLENDEAGIVLGIGRRAFKSRAHRGRWELKKRLLNEFNFSGLK